MRSLRRCRKSSECFQSFTRPLRKFSEVFWKAFGSLRFVRKYRHSVVVKIREKLTDSQPSRVDDLRFFFWQYCDAELWMVLERCHLLQAVRELGMLNYIVFYFHLFCAKLGSGQLSTPLVLRDLLTIIILRRWPRR